MPHFQVHTIDSAPADSTSSLRALQDGLGFLPNLAATMAESPTLISGFVGLREILAGSTLTGVEREIVALATSFENDCDYCMAAHSTFALMQNADEDAVAAARGGEAPADRKLGALYRVARDLAAGRGRGRVRDEVCQALLDVGYPCAALFDVVAQVGHTTLANLAHSMSHAPLDEAFMPEAWEKAPA
jgi:AhpD family alkylhydroperoxidase